MEAARTSETMVNFYQTTGRYNPEDSHLSKSDSWIGFIIYLNKEGSSMDKSVFGNPLLKYIAFFNIRDNEKQGNIGTAFC
jgi:hypothetical protein